MQIKYFIGIDEVGRGPVAGPVAVGAIFVLADNLNQIKKEFINFKDSKKLTPKKRSVVFKNIQKLKKDLILDYRVVFVDNKNIDKFGIAPAIKSCISKILFVDKIKTKPEECLVLLDGGFKAPKEFVNQKTIIKGDEKELLIALASIMAKVTRDSLMCKFAKEYLVYGFEKHKGYGTKSHLEAIKKYGLCPIHRKSFLGKFLK